MLASLPHGHLREIVVVGAPGADLPDTARRYGATAVEEGRAGYGRACLTGMVHLAPEPPDVVVFLRGDGTDDAEELPAVLSPLLSPEVDFVVGSRNRGEPDSGAYPGLVRCGHWIATRLILLLYGYRFTDLGPFRAIRWQALSQLGLSDPDYGWLAEMQVGAARAGITTVEVPVSSRRPAGRGSRDTTLTGLFLAGLKVLLTVLRPRSADPPRIRKTDGEPEAG